MLTPSLYVTNPRTLNLFKGVFRTFFPFSLKIKCSVVKQNSESKANQIALISEKWRDKDHWWLSTSFKRLFLCAGNSPTYLSHLYIKEWRPVSWWRQYNRLKQYTRIQKLDSHNNSKFILCYCFTFQSHLEFLSKVHILEIL